MVILLYKLVWHDSETNVQICDLGVCVCVRAHIHCRLEYMPAEGKRHLWSGFTVASSGLCSQRWQDCGVAQV